MGCDKAYFYTENPALCADINPILHKIAHFNRVNRKNKKRDKSKKEDLSRCVPRVGIEPTLLAEPDFESGASTNSATEAKGRQM